jgi:uncharacterized damage-inducible protein DinB
MDDAIERFRQSREALNAVIARFSDEALSKPVSEGEWTIIEEMAHLAAWDNWARKVIELRLTQDEIPREMSEEARNPDPFNARAAAAWKGYTPSQARTAFLQAYQDLMDFVEHTPEDKLYRQIPRPNGKTTTPVASLKALVGHNDEHRARLEEILARQ